MIFTITAFADGETEIRGTLSWTETHFAVVTECNTRTTYIFGVMASSPYFKLMREAEKLAKNGPVMVTVRGIVVGADQSIIEEPQVLSIESGSCENGAT